MQRDVGVVSAFGRASLGRLANNVELDERVKPQKGFLLSLKTYDALGLDGGGWVKNNGCLGWPSK